MWAGQLRWAPLTHHRVLQVLKNPAYAGAYVHGRHVTRKRVDADGNVRTVTTEVPRAQWAVVIKDHHPGYLTWEEYLAIEARLAANHTGGGGGPAREGTALCQGIIICGGCGGPMAANYHGDDRASYECHSHRDGKKTPGCRGITAHAVDDAVAAVLLAALTPEQLALALAAADEVAGQHQRASRAAELAVERARYEADRAERAFGQVEPENRLVARTLEARWEAKLAALADADQALQAAQDALPPLPDRASLAKLAADLPALWHAPTTTARDRKRLLRTLIADVTLLPEPDRGKARIGIRWHTGAADQIIIDRPGPTGIPAPTPTPAAQLIRELGPVTSNPNLVTLLAQRGYLTGAGRPFDIKAVQWVRHVYQIPSPSPYRAARSASPTPPAARLSPGVVYYWIETGSWRPAAAPAAGSASPGPPPPRRMPGPHRQLRAPQPRRPANQAPPASLNTTGMSQPHGTITPARPENPANPETSRQEGQYEITVPSWSDKLVGEVVRILLEAYYEPRFSGRSHGFRPGRGCHTALTEVANTWKGTTWFIEGDISDCFGSLGHDLMVKILAEHIHDNRFLRLIKGMLRAGYLEDWVWNADALGCPPIPST